MALNPKLALKSVASIKTFGAVYKVDNNHAWLLPIDENNRRCQAAGYSGLKDYLIRKGLKLTKWKETGLIKELITPNGERMTFDKQLPVSKLPNPKSALKENVLSRTSSCSVKKTDGVLSPKRIRSLSPSMRHAPVKYVESTEQKIDSNINISHTSINVCYTMRRSKTLSVLKCDKENSASKPRNAVPPAPGKSLMCLPKLSLKQPSEEKLTDSIHICSKDKQNILKGSLSYRKIDRKNSSSTAKVCPKLEMRVTHRQVNNTNSKHRRDNNVSKPPNSRASKRSETVCNSRENTFAEVPPSENLERNTEGSTTSTCISMFTARSSTDSFKDRKEAVIRIDIRASETDICSKESPENIATTLLYVAEGCGIGNEATQSKSSTICIDQKIEKEEEEDSENNYAKGEAVCTSENNYAKGEAVCTSENNYAKGEAVCTSENNYAKGEVMCTSETAADAPEYSEQTSDSKPKSTEASSDDRLTSESASIPHESALNNEDTDSKETHCSVSEMCAKECLKTDENCVINKRKNCKEPDAEFGAVEFVSPALACITQKLHISHALSEQSIPETSLTLNCSDRNYSSLIDVRCTLKDVKCTLKDMRRSLEHCSKASQKVGDAGVTGVLSEHAVSKQFDIEVQEKSSNKSVDNNIIARITDAEAVSGGYCDGKETAAGADESENTSYNTAVTKKLEVSHENETLRPVLLLDRNISKGLGKANSFHELPTLRNNFPDKVFLEIEASNSYSSVVIRKLIECPLYTQDMYESLSSAISPNICCQLQHPIRMKRLLLQKHHEMLTTTEPCCERNTSHTKIKYKDAETQTQKYFDETDDESESKILRAGVSDVTETVDEHTCQNPDEDAECVHEDSREIQNLQVDTNSPEIQNLVPGTNSPEIQNLQVDTNDKDEDSDEFSVYEDALELF